MADNGRRCHPPRPRRRLLRRRRRVPRPPAGEARAGQAPRLGRRGQVGRGARRQAARGHPAAPTPRGRLADARARVGDGRQGQHRQRGRGHRQRPDGPRNHRHARLAGRVRARQASGRDHAQGEGHGGAARPEPRRQEPDRGVGVREEAGRARRVRPARADPPRRDPGGVGVPRPDRAGVRPEGRHRARAGDPRGHDRPRARGPAPVADHAAGHAARGRRRRDRVRRQAPVRPGEGVRRREAPVARGLRTRPARPGGALARHR